MFYGNVAIPNRSNFPYTAPTMNQKYSLHLLASAACAVAFPFSAANAAIAIVDGAFDTTITTLATPFSMASTAPVYGQWTAADTTGNWELGGTAPDTYAFGDATNTANSRLLFQLIEDDKATTGEITINYSLNNLPGSNPFSLNLHVFGFNKDTAWSLFTNNESGNPTGQQFTSTTALTNDTGGAWQSFSTTVDLGATGYDQIAIGFGYVGLNTGNGQLQLDNVSVTAIPEPSTYPALLGALAVGFVALRRRIKC